jgi:hypothetical protein
VFAHLLTRDAVLFVIIVLGFLMVIVVMPFMGLVIAFFL